MLLFDADNATVTRNTFVGAGTDIGIAVSAGSTGARIAFNRVTRTPSTNPDNTDPTGIGISVGPRPVNSATLICNTFDGWNQNIDGAIQIACTPLPDGTECVPYSASAPTVEGNAAPPLRWRAPPGTLPPGLTLARNGTISGTPPDTTAGTYRFRLRVVTADNLIATTVQRITIAPGCVDPTPEPGPSPTPEPTPTPPTPTNQPVVSTVTSDRRVPPGQPFHDRIRVSGLAGNQAAAAVARLYGPFESRAAATCDDRFRVRALALQVRNGSNRTTPDIRIDTAGVYTWRVTLLADADNKSATHRCGQAAETTVVAKPAFVAPAVIGGFSGTLPGFDRDRRLDPSATIEMPGIGMRAAVQRHGIVGRKMTLPGDVGDVGWLRRSAGFGDMIGTAVVGGHVSDRHDRPGAMFNLRRAHAGQRITVTQAGERHRFKVVEKTTLDKRQKLPDRFFATTGKHRLVLISCTDRVVTSGGHFHYTRYIVVVAKQVHRHR